MLHCLLGAYVCYRPDVGYVQGMSFIAAVLILNLEAADAFVCFANLLNRPCHVAFFCLNQTVVSILKWSVLSSQECYHWQVLPQWWKQIHLNDCMEHSFMRSWELLSPSRYLSSFMEPEYLLLCSRDPDTWPYHNLVEFSLHPRIPCL